MWTTKVVVASWRYPYRTPSLIDGPHEILYDRSVEADSQVLNTFILLFQDQHYDLKSVAKVWRDSFILPQNTSEWQQKIKSTLNITISTATFAKQKPSSSSKPPPREVFLRSHRQNGMCHKIRTTYAHDDTRLDIVHVACLTSVETGICPTGGVWTSKPEYVFIGRRYPQCVRAAQQGERRRGTRQCKVQ